MTDEEWEKQRARAILAAFQTGRPVFADSEGKMRYVDGGGERLPDEVGVPRSQMPIARTRASWWVRLKHWLRGRS